MSLLLFQNIFLVYDVQEGKTNFLVHRRFIFHYHKTMDFKKGKKDRVVQKDGFLSHLG